jgi:1-deoxy-D-xylulose-5-phosphate reductoisomerase
MKQKIAILGATGSIGTQTLSIINQFPNQFSVTLLTCNNKFEKLIDLSLPFKCQLGIHDQKAKHNVSSNYSFLFGNKNITSFLINNPPDILVFAVSSIDSFTILKEVYPVCKKIAISSKEILVLAGISGLLKQISKKVRLLPLDSEHVAVHELVRKILHSQIKKIILTASGGPFYRNEKKIDFTKITPEIALKHPTWQMGKKVSIDSATLVNKGIELMEAKYLFDLPCSKLDVVIHPESIIHSFCELTDGSIFCQLAYPNMELPIAYSLFFPKRKTVTTVKKLNFDHFPNLTFRKVSARTLPAINLAFDCMLGGGFKEIQYLIADELAVELFFQRKINYQQIVPLIENVINYQEKNILLNPDNILEHYSDLKKMINSKVNTLIKKQGRFL